MHYDSPLLLGTIAAAILFSLVKKTWANWLVKMLCDLKRALTLQFFFIIIFH